MAGPRADDPWTSARERAREDVRAIFAPRARRCASCGEESAAPGRACPRCGAPYVAVAPPRRLSRRAGLAAGVAFAALAATAALVLPTLDDGADAERARAERERAAARAATVRAIERQATPRQGGARPPARPLAAPAERAARGRLVARLERAVLADARARVRAGTLAGPILDARCAPYPRSVAGRGAESDPARRFGRYECLAATARIPANAASVGGSLGHPFLARVDFERFRWAFCKVSPPPGEKAIPSAAPRVPRACTTG